MNLQEPNQMHFECLCRTCMHQLVALDGTEKLLAEEPQQWQSIFDTVVDCGALRIAELLSTTTPQLIVQTNDELPQKICRDCLQRLLTVYKFQQMCLESDKQMRNLLQKNEKLNHVGMHHDLDATREASAIVKLPLAIPPISPLMMDVKTSPDHLQQIHNIDKVTDEEQTSKIQDFFIIEMNEQDFGEDTIEGTTENALLNDDGNIAVKLEVPEVQSMTEDHSSGDDWTDIPQRKRKKRKMTAKTPKRKTAKAESSVEECTAEKANSDPFHCTQCEKMFTKKRYLSRHLKLHHNSIQCNKYQEANSTSFPCIRCEKVFNSKRYLNRHIKRHEAAIRKQGLPPQPVESYEYKCDECPRHFINIEAFHRHRQTHDPNFEVPPLEFVCDVCSKKFESRRLLTKHKHVHSDKLVQKQYVCKYCDKSFQQSCTLKDHVRTHTGEQPFLCSECGKAFNSSSNMKQHLLRHSGVKRYECPQCPMKFPCPSDLASHKAVHSSEKPHICDQCGAAFGKPYQLKKHKMYHNGEKPHKCEYCEMRFVCNDHMRRHMRTHTGEKPYKCKYCERAFAQSNDLIKHLRSHLGENVYRCELCPNAFRLANELRQHFTLHKNEDAETREKNMKALMETEKRFGLNISKMYSQPSQTKQNALDLAVERLE